MPKIAVLATGVAAAVLVVTVNPLPAQATPRASDCTGCHASTSGATTTVTATPSSGTVASAAAYTVAITLSANPGGGFTGYGIVPVAPATEKTFGGNTGSELSFTANMVAPAAAGTYSYTVWTNQGPTSGGQVGSKVYSITVGAVATVPPTTIPPTTSPPTTVPPTTVPPTTVPPTTLPPTTIPPTTVPPTTVPPTTVPPTTLPPTIRPMVRVSEDDLRPSSVVGTKHLGMYASYGDMTCKTCHNGLRPTSQLAPPVISGEGLNMGSDAACGTCHDGRREFTIFVANMQPVKVTPTSPAGTQIAYGRCSDCHTIAGGGDSGGGGGDSDD